MSEDMDAPGYDHIMPVNDLREHETHSRCWCRPQIVFDDMLVVHNSMDRREHTIEKGVVQ